MSAGSDSVAPTPTELERLLEAATPLIECDHRANDPRGERERLVGFVIDQDLIGLGLSEALFALRALVDLAKATPAHLAAIASLQSEIEGLRAYMREASVALVRLSGGGSEMFKNVAGEPYADPELCARQVEDKIETIHRLCSARAALQTMKAKP